MVRLALLLVDDRETAEDVAQDAFAALHRRWDSLSTQDAAIGYLRACVVNGARSVLRRRRTVRRNPQPAEDLLTVAPADGRVLLAEEHREVIAALRQLPVAAARGDRVALLVRTQRAGDRLDAWHLHRLGQVKRVSWPRCDRGDPRRCRMNSFDLDERIRSALAAQADQVTEADLEPAPLPAAEGVHIAAADPALEPPLAAAAACRRCRSRRSRRDDRRGHRRASRSRAAGAHPDRAGAVRGADARPSAAPTLDQAGASATTSAGSATADAAAPVPPRRNRAPAPPRRRPARPRRSTSATSRCGRSRHLTAAKDWQAAYRSGGQQPWHLDAGQTALSFTRGYLGFNEINIVTSTRTDSIGAHIGVGYRDPNGTARTAAVLHLVRFGTDSDSPWEVVGSDDATFSLEIPAYGSVVHSPVTVGGHITGVDENIRVDDAATVRSRRAVLLHAGGWNESAVDGEGVLLGPYRHCGYDRRQHWRSPAGRGAIRDPGRAQPVMHRYEIDDCGVQPIESAGRQ